MLKFDREITISVGEGRKSLLWLPRRLLWSALVSRLSTPVRGRETLSQYLNFEKSRQDDLKDVGGFVGGTLADNRRRADAVLYRDVITLDLDNIPEGEAEELLRRVDAISCAYCVYSTRKHRREAPRLRVLFPLDRGVSAEEYQAIARAVAARIDEAMRPFDPSTFEPSRLMYWPSCCRDGEYVHKYGDFPFLSADGALAQYPDWRRAETWPQVPGAGSLRSLAGSKRRGDPAEKPGIIGAFCRAYDIYRAMETLIPGVYLESDIPGRFTYFEGSTAGGAVVYQNGRFLYSHHGTDPCGGKLCNAFDLVRLHRFGFLDEDAKAGTPVNKLPSYAAMRRLALEDESVEFCERKLKNAVVVENHVHNPVQTVHNWENAGEKSEEPVDKRGKAVDKREITGEKRKEAGEKGVETGEKGGDIVEKCRNDDYLRELTRTNSTGEVAKTIDNVRQILENDPLLSGGLTFDEFANRLLAARALPWDEREIRRPWTDTDDAGLRQYLEKTYNITGRDKINDAAALCARNNRVNDVADYLNGLVWDGEERLSTLLHDYLGAEDNAYTRQVSRKSLAAAVARALSPGVKYDCMPILAGPQGIGKSTLLRILGGRWFCDSLNTFEGKEAREMVQGVWINELGELTGLSRSETNAVKQFLSQQEDTYREPYGRRTSVFPRRCVFFGTTNDTEFLRDQSGERRFWPVDVGVFPPKKDVFTDLEAERDQLWAEAVARYREGEFLDLTGEVKAIWEAEVRRHKTQNPKEGIVRDFLARPLPGDWKTRALPARRLFWASEHERENVPVTARDRVCALEIWCECFGREIGSIRQTDSREINQILGQIEGWKRQDIPRRHGIYGKQRGFFKGENAEAG